MCLITIKKNSNGTAIYKGGLTCIERINDSFHWACLNQGK